MPQLNLIDALRYFFSPFVVFFYLAVYSPRHAIWLQASFGTVGLVSFLVAGTVVYFVYRQLLYNPLILWLHDTLGRRHSYRRYLGDRYSICRGRFWLPSCTLRARRLYLHIKLPTDRSHADPTRLRASGIHLLYQAGLWTIPFIAFSISKSMCLVLFFGVSGVLLLWAAFLADKDYEEEELVVLKGCLDQADEAAKSFGYAKNCEG